MIVRAFLTAAAELEQRPRKWLVTGAAGFIGSHLVERLLGMGQSVVGLDNFATGKQRNLDDVRAAVGDQRASAFQFFEGDIRELETCKQVCEGVDAVLHQAALGSVPRSIDNPIATNQVNVDGFLNMLVAARDTPVTRFVYASSSATYGDHPALPKTEAVTGRPLSPYATTKYVNELYAANFGELYGLETIGLRYFNVFGPRQDPNGPYAAVIPRWIEKFVSGETPLIYGDGETSRDFCFVENAVAANILAAVADKKAVGQVYNVAAGQRTTLNELCEFIRNRVAKTLAAAGDVGPQHTDFRPGDVRHSLANIEKARRLLGYEVEHDVREGLDITVDWFLSEGGSAGA